MSWFVALLWLVSGLVSGLILGAGGIVYLVSFNVYHYPMRRLEFLRIFAQRWPEDFELALSHSQVIHPGEDEWAHACEPIQFGTCAHCQLPWPLEGGKLIQHQMISLRPYKGELFQSCKGSNSEDYHVAE